jgi:predicted membrane protein (TIGR00267 family)
MIKKCQNASYLRNFIFGVEDSLVSTIGLLSGIAIAGVQKETILITGIILIFVEAVSMAAGSFVSESSVEEYINKKEETTSESIFSSIIMFFSYFLSGFIVILPYMIFPVSEAFKISIVLSIFSLFILGIISGKISKINIFKNGLKMAIVGGLAILVGTLAGNLLTDF